MTLKVTFESVTSIISIFTVLEFARSWSLLGKFSAVKFPSKVTLYSNWLFVSTPGRF